MTKSSPITATTTTCAEVALAHGFVRESPSSNIWHPRNRQHTLFIFNGDLSTQPWKVMKRGAVSSTMAASGNGPFDLDTWLRENLS